MRSWDHNMYNLESLGRGGTPWGRQIRQLVYRLAYSGDVVAFKLGRRLGKRVAGSAYRRVGSKTAFRHGCNDQEVSPELMMLCKRRHADTPIRRYVSPKGLPLGAD
jgi:hypothetical protein